MIETVSSHDQPKSACCAWNTETFLRSKGKTFNVKAQWLSEQLN